MIREIITIICVAGLAGAAMYFSPDYSKDVVLTAMGGLIGYLSRDQATHLRDNKKEAKNA